MNFLGSWDSTIMLVMQAPYVDFPDYYDFKASLISWLFFA